MIEEPRLLVWDDRLEEADKEEVAKLNAALARLSALRAVEITVSDHFARSKIAWKLACYQHVLLHRVVALLDGAAVAWNHRCTLSAILSARAFMETFAVMFQLRQRISKHLASESLADLDDLAQHGIFSTRDEELLAEHPKIKAKNAKSYVQDLDKRIPGFYGHYALLSERCHPNAMGHNFMFSKLDQSDGTVQFTGERDPDQNGHAIIAGLAVLPTVEQLMFELDDLNLKVADLQHRIAPISLAGLARELRKRLVIEGQTVSAHADCINDLRKDFPHTIRCIDRPANGTCLTYALGLLVGGDQLCAEFQKEDIRPGTIFAHWLLDRRKLTKISAPEHGTLVFYFNSGHWTHAGILETESRIRSKWGLYAVFEHQLHEVSDEYGDEIQIYKLPAAADARQWFFEFGCEALRFNAQEIARYRALLEL